MKSIVKVLFAFLLTFFAGKSNAQTKFLSLNDACTRRNSESSRTIYIPSYNVGQYAFLNNSNRNFRRLGQGFYYNPVNNSAFQVGFRGVITNIQSCVVAAGNFQIQDTYTKGLTGDSNYQIDPEGSIWHNPLFNETWTQMSVNFVPNTNRITINTDTRGWGSGSGTLKFKLEMSPIWYTKEQIEAMDFSLHRGKDISIIGALMDGSNNIQDSKQSIVHIAGDANSTVPTWFKRPAGKRIGSPSYFPNFNLAGKFNIQNYGSLDANFNYENHQYLSKGFNQVTEKGNPLVSSQNSMLSEYDQWAIANGCPESHGGQNNQAAACVWLETTPMNLLYQYYQPIIGAGNAYGSIFHDFEAFGYEILNHQVACNRLASLHRAFKQANPNCLMTSYINAKPVEIAYDATITEAQMLAENAKYNQAFSLLAKGFFKKSIQYVDLYTGNPTGETGLMSDNLGIAIVGDYAHRYNDSQFYAFVQEMELARQFVTNKKLVSLSWSYIETYQGQSPQEINTVRRYYRKSNGFIYFNDYKVAVPFSEMYNRAMWANFIVDGQWTWHDPSNAVDGYDYHGGNAKDVRAGTELEPAVKPQDWPYLKNREPNQFVPGKFLGSMEISTTVGYDYGQLAMWELSLNNDVLPQATQKADFSTNNGTTYYTGEDLKPASAEFRKIPIVRYKKLGNVYLILAMNKHLEHHQQQTIKVRIDGKTVDITLNGQFSTLKRVVLV